MTEESVRCTSASELWYSTLTGPTFSSVEIFRQCRQRHTIIDKSNLHHGLKYAILDLFRVVELLYSSEKAIVELPCFVTASCTMEIRLVAFPS